MIIKKIAEFNVGRWIYTVERIEYSDEYIDYQLTRVYEDQRDVVSVARSIFGALNCPDIPIWLAMEVEEGVYNV